MKLTKERKDNIVEIVTEFIQKMPEEIKSLHIRDCDNTLYISFTKQKGGEQ